MQKLILIAGFWRNGEPGGIGLRFIRNALPVSQRVERVLLGYENVGDKHADYANIHKMALTNLAKRLVGYHHVEAETNNPEVISKCILGLASIAWLERHGYITPDEHNGMIYVYSGI